MTGIAYSLLPTRFEDGRHNAIEAGLRAVGWKVVHHQTSTPNLDSGDLCVTWNAYGSSGAIADQVRKNGGTAIVAEEAYIRKIDGEKYFALALGGHNGAGTWETGGPERWAGWNIPIKPWAGDGDHIIVCGQRGFGYNVMAMPDDWPDKVHDELRAVTNRPLFYRAHPKRRRRMPTARYDKILNYDKPLDSQLYQAWACVVWSSSSGITALLQGVPVIYRAPHTVIESACSSDLTQIENVPSFDRRRKALERMAWAQWSMVEIKRGDPFRFNGLERRRA